MFRFAVPFLVVMLLLLMSVGGRAQLPAIGEWDGVTASAKLAGPYEDPAQAVQPFGIISYFNMPWRSYMDTWPADHFTHFCGTQWNVDGKYADALCQLLEESGIRNLRIEVGWGNTGWDDDLMPHVKANLRRLLPIVQRHHIRPLILLNAHHGVPCPVRDVWVEVTAEAKKGDKILKLKAGTPIRCGYMGIQHPEYIANYPTITKIDADGAAMLSAGLPFDIKVGRFRLVETKYQPFQGVKLKDGTPVPAARESFDGWLAYAANTGRCVREMLGTEDAADAGFDVEVWNEQTFGSNFLDINRYYDEKLQFAEPFVYRHERAPQPGYAPKATLKFEQKGAYAILPMTIDYYQDPKNGFPGVHVISGFANQWPWDNGTGLWDGQAGFSRHYYTGGWRDSSPQTPLGNARSGVVDALGQFEGKKDNKDWHTVEPGSYFIPTFRLGCPEFCHLGFKTETLSRDVLPDSRIVYFRDHGRFTHNGDFRTAELWQTEVNYDRSQFFGELRKQTGAKNDDPKLLALDEHMAGKMLLRQYIFHAGKGLYRIFLFSPQADPYQIGMLPKAFYQALDKSNYALTDEVRKTVPPEFTGLGWLVKLLDSGQPLKSPRALALNELVEYKPRLAYAGDGTPAHPHRWNRDNFVFLPYQLNTSHYVIPYYVATLDVSHAWDAAKDPLDPARYDMPEQEFDVTVGNLRGAGAKVSVYDPLTNTDVPAQIVADTENSLTVRLKTVDYPRVLQITETQPGMQIFDPRATLGRDGNITVAWRTNLPAAAASVSYGKSWGRRDDNVIELEKGKTEYRVTIPAARLEGSVPAVRVRVSANGLAAVWPRWDEDPAGQVPFPVAPIDLTTVLSSPPDRPMPPAAPAPKPEITLPAPAFTLAEEEINTEHGYTVRLPKGIFCTGRAGDRECNLGGVTLRIRFLAKAQASLDDYLPPLSTIDTQDRQPVATPAGNVHGLRISILLAATAHPGMTNLAQQYLAINLGKSDLLLLSAVGTPEKMAVCEQALSAIWAGINFGVRQVLPL